MSNERSDERGNECGSEPVLTGVLIDDATLTLDEFCAACATDRDWVIVRVETGLLECCEKTGTCIEHRFASRHLLRARQLLDIERDFDANAELAALVVDLSEEVRRLRVRLAALGDEDGGEAQPSNEVRTACP